MFRETTDRAAPSPSRSARMARLARLANRFDSQFRIPGTKIRFGWDSILGLIPGLGAIATVAPAVILGVEGARLGARNATLVRMAGNTAIDLVVGGIPVVGDVFDVFFKSHRRNLALLERDIGP